MRNRFFGNGEVRPGRRQYMKRSRVSVIPLPSPPEEKVPEVPVIGELIVETTPTLEQLPPPAAEEKVPEALPVVLDVFPEPAGEEKTQLELLKELSELTEDILLEEQPKKKRGKQKKSSTI